LIKAGGAEVASLLDGTCNELGLSRGHPDWRAYVDFVSNVVVGGLVQVAIVSLEYLEVQLDPIALLHSGASPMLNLDLDLVGASGVTFVPSVARVLGSGRDPHKQGIRDVAQGWLDAFLAVGAQFPRLDSGEGSYVKELQDDPYVAMLLAANQTLLAGTERKAEEYRKHFDDYK
jgi:dynein heavy chain